METPPGLLRRWSREDVHAATPRLAATVAPFLSVRTAFDLYLKALKLPRGSLVVCSALTIPDMITIFEEHGLIPVPVDLDPDTLAPAAGALESEIQRCSAKGGGAGGGGESVRAIYVAHVFGAQVDMSPVVDVAARHSVLLWEDCAQVFTGRQGYLGHPQSDATFFSFGVIKRATALGGGIARIADRSILSDMLREEASYPAQPPLTYLRRVLKCSLLLTFTSPLLYGIIIHTVRIIGIEHDKLAMKLSKGFPKKGLLNAIRHRPAIPLLQMLARRITWYTPKGVEIRLRHCNRMLRLLSVALARQTSEKREGVEGPALEGIGDLLPGIRAHRHTLWLYPVMVGGGADKADRLVEALLGEGFDATRAPTSLMPIDRCITKREDCGGGAVSSTSLSATPRCSAMMDSLVYLPLSNNIPDSEVDRMALALARALLSSSSAVSKELGTGVESRAGRNKERRKAAQRLMAFAFRLDVIVVSTILTIISATCMLLNHLI